MYKTYKPHEIIRAFKLCIKKYQKEHKLLESKYYEKIVELLIREVRGEPIGFLKYFEDFLPNTSKDYFAFLYNTQNPIRNMIYYRHTE